jgi:hypothetical protein
MLVIMNTIRPNPDYLDQYDEEQQDYLKKMEKHASNNEMVPLSDKLQNVPEDAIDFISKCLTFDKN